MKHYGYGVLAAFCATVALSICMLIKMAVGIPPPMNVVHLLAGLGHHLFGTPAVPLLGWIAHFAIGSLLWGLVFAGLYARLPGAPVVRGVVFATAAWVLMMVVIMPLAGKGAFAAEAGPGIAVATLVLHWIYGGVLGGTMGIMSAPSAARRVPSR